MVSAWPVEPLAELIRLGIQPQNHTRKLKRKRAGTCSGHRPSQSAAPQSPRFLSRPVAEAVPEAWNYAAPLRPLPARADSLRRGRGENTLFLEDAHTGRENRSQAVGVGEVSRPGPHLSPRTEAGVLGR